MKNVRPYFSLWSLFGKKPRAVSGVAIRLNRKTGLSVNSNGHIYARARIGGFTIRKRVR